MFEPKYTLGDTVKCILQCIGALQCTFQKKQFNFSIGFNFVGKNYTLSSNQWGEIIFLMDYNPMTHRSQKCMGRISESRDSVGENNSRIVVIRARTIVPMWKHLNQRLIDEQVIQNWEHVLD